MRGNRRQLYDELARILLPEERVTTPMIGVTTAGSPDEETEVDGIPLPLGDVGDVLTVVTDGTDTVAAWAAPTGGGGPASGRYRSILYELDGSGGFDFLVDEDGHPIYELTELE